MHPRTRSLFATAALGSLTLLLACGGSTTSATRESSGPWPAAPSQVTYAAPYGTLLPAAVTSATGTTSPQSATAGEAFTLSYPSGGTAPSIVLDYGKLVGGYPQFQVVSVTGAPTLKTTFSEALPYIDSGDQPPYLETAFEPSRALSTELSSSSGFVKKQLLQGGERYEKLTLTTPGTAVTLKAVGLDATLAAPDATADQAGYFSSSSSTLNAVWEAGAYAVELNRIDAYKLPTPWTLSSEGIRISPSNPAIYQGMGFSNTGTTTSFDFRVETGGVSWTVNATFPSTVQFTLNASDDATSPNTLTGSEGGSFNTFLRSSMDPIALATPLEPGTWHTVTTTCNPISPIGDGQVSVTLDGTPIATIDPAAVRAASPLAAAIPTYLALGTSGFFNEEGHVATVRNFSLAGIDFASGYKTYTAAFTDGDSSVLDDFGVGTNPVAVVTDGARRDRQVWSGDMLVSAPTIYCTTDNIEPIQGSLNLLASYLDSNGQIASVLAPQSALDVTSNRSAGPANPWYSLGYSMYFIDILHDYYLHTGDLGLVTRLWPAAQKELAFLSSQQDATTGLISTTSSTGWTWHPQYDAYQTGLVSEFNIDYVRCLQHASALATALGWSTDATSYADLATTVKTAINANLYNSSTGVYEISDTKTGYVAQDANAKAILFGVAPSDQVSTIFSAMDNALATNYGNMAYDSTYFTTYNSGAGVVSPFASNWELLARLEQGDTSGALDLINKLWGRMVASGNYSSGATWESLDASTGYPVDDNISLAHAWASGPTAALSKYVLGVRPVTAGYSTWLVRPQMGTLSWASGRVPTPYGPITFKWAQNHDGVPFKAELSVPAGTTGTLAVPVVSGAQVVKVDGSTVTPGTSYTLGGVTYLPVSISSSGTYTIETSK
nr:alpha-L-rhamnosidase C-terminal domain-containing protein [uncultured Holophaga sp.]